jgi:hypothetical protein
METTVTNNIDDFILDKDSTFWIATLTDGTVVYEDDGRPGTNEPSWIRLRNYCKVNNLGLAKIAVKFRSHYEELMDFEYGAFFRRMALGSFGTTKTQLYYIFGTINENGDICTKKWKVPELIEDAELSDVRNVAGNEESIIWNLSHPQLESLLAKLNISLN